MERHLERILETTTYYVRGVFGGGWGVHCVALYVMFINCMPNRVKCS